MGNLLNVCASARSVTVEQKSVMKRRFDTSVQEDQGGIRQEDEKPILRAMIGPIGGRGPLNSEQEAGRRRFGM
jgi:hypothetical protein